MKKVSIKILWVLILFIFVLQINIGVIATSKTDLENEQSGLDKQINEKKDEIQEIQGNKSKALKQVQELTGQISEYEGEIEDLDDQIGSLNKEIKVQEENLKEAQEDYTETENILNERLVAVYENGETSYLDFLLSSNSLTDFISNYYLISELTTYDAELLDQIEKKKNEIEEKKQKLETNKKSLATTKSSKQAKQTQLQNTKTQKAKYAKELNEEEKKAQAELEQFEKDKQAIRAKLKKIAEEEAKKNPTKPVITGNPSASGYIFPVAGCNSSSIRNKSYPSYRGHTGVDANIGVAGKSVVAVKSGTVVISKALRNSSGGYRSYGEYVVINHGDGTMTLYAHMSPGTRRVSEGQKVSQGQVLGIVGTTGNSTGTHLHFEVIVKGRPVNPIPYLP